MTKNNGRAFRRLGAEGVRDATSRCFSDRAPCPPQCGARRPDRGRSAARIRQCRDHRRLHQELWQPDRARRARRGRGGGEGERRHCFPLHPDLARQRGAADCARRRGAAGQARRLRVHAGRHQGHGGRRREDHRGGHSPGQCERPARGRRCAGVRRHRRLCDRARDRPRPAQGHGRQGQRRGARGPRHDSDRRGPVARFQGCAERISGGEGPVLKERDVCAAGGRRSAQGRAQIETGPRDRRRARGQRCDGLRRDRGVQGSQEEAADRRDQCQQGGGRVHQGRRHAGERRLQRAGRGLSGRRDRDPHLA